MLRLKVEHRAAHVHFYCWEAVGVALFGAGAVGRFYFPVGLLGGEAVLVFGD